MCACAICTCAWYGEKGEMEAESSGTTTVQSTKLLWKWFSARAACLEAQSALGTAFCSMHISTATTIDCFPGPKYVVSTFNSSVWPEKCWLWFLYHPPLQLSAPFLLPVSLVPPPLPSSTDLRLHLLWCYHPLWDHLWGCCWHISEGNWAAIRLLYCAEPDRDCRAVIVISLLFVDG